MKSFVSIFAVAVLLLVSPAAWGQVLFVASLDQSQEPTPTGSGGQGTAWAVLSPDFGTLRYSVTYASLDSTFTAGHFHVAPLGVSGPVVFPLNFADNTAEGTWSDVPDTVVQALLRGSLYVNVHSQKFPGGEIRGQLTMVSGPGFSISLSPSQEVPPLDSGATGTGWAALDTAGTVRYHATIAGLSDRMTGAHFHVAPPGVSGPVVHPVTFTDSTAQDSAVTLTDSVLIQMLRGNIYLNVHSATHPGGETRGQLVQESGIRFVAWLDGSQSDPAVETDGEGTAWGRLSPDLASLTYRATYAQLDSTFTASHFHIAPSGSVVHPVSFSGNTTEGSWDGISDANLLALLRGDIYLNIHSVAHPGGEISGFYRVAQGMEFTISMDGSQESPPVSTGATGTGWAVLDSSAARISYRATIAGLSDTLRAAHFHSAPLGVSGPVVQPVSFEDSTTQGVWSAFPDSILAGLLGNRIYLNVHSNTYPAGEIRGQLLYGDPVSTSVEPVAGSGIPSSFALEQNYPNPFNPSTAIEFQLHQTSRVSLKVFNLLGQEVATLLDDVKQAGVYRVTFDASQLSSGVYVYRLTAGNGLTAARKMMLLK